MAGLHPALGTPPHELDLLTLHVLAPHHRCRAVILLDAIVADQPAISQVTLQLRPRIGCRMLDIWPVDATPGELQVCLHSFLGVVRVADDQPSDNVQAIPAQVIACGFGSNAASSAVFALGVLRSRRRNAKSSARTFPMPRKTYLKPALRISGASHSPWSAMEDVIA